MKIYIVIETNKLHLYPSKENKKTQNGYNIQGQFIKLIAVHELKIKNRYWNSNGRAVDNTMTSTNQNKIVTKAFKYKRKLEFKSRLLKNK